MTKPLVAAVVALLLTSTAPALAQRGGGGLRGGGIDAVDARANLSTVSIRIMPIGRFCVRAIAAVGYEPRLNQQLYRIEIDSGPMNSLGISAYENALQSARTPAEARVAVSAARQDAGPFRRDRPACG